MGHRSCWEDDSDDTGTLSIMRATFLPEVTEISGVGLWEGLCQRLFKHVGLRSQEREQGLIVPDAQGTRHNREQTSMNITAWSYLSLQSFDNDVKPRVSIHGIRYRMKFGLSLGI